MQFEAIVELGGKTATGIEAPGYAVVDLDMDLVERTRKAIPVLANAREL